MDYYVGNGIYEYLIENHKTDKFFWTSQDLWILVYGDLHQEPKVVTVVSANRIANKLSNQEIAAVKIAKKIVEGTDIIINFVRFNPGKQIEKVAYWSTGMSNIPIITAEDLQERFANCGLTMNNAKTNKFINDKSSSPYHDWQRAHMGDSVTVSDVDLIHFNGAELYEIIELKRSYIGIDRWEPYRQDYNNFVLLSKLCRKRNLDFYILYNYRSKYPFYDDVSKVKIFEFDHRLDTYYRLLGQCNIEAFANTNKVKEIEYGENENGNNRHHFK